MIFLKDIWEKRRFSKILTYGHICRTLGSKSIPHGVEFYIYGRALRENYNHAFSFFPFVWE